MCVFIYTHILTFVISFCLSSLSLSIGTEGLPQGPQVKGPLTASREEKGFPVYCLWFVVIRERLSIRRRVPEVPGEVGCVPHLWRNMTFLWFYSVIFSCCGHYSSILTGFYKETATACNSVKQWQVCLMPQDHVVTKSGQKKCCHNSNWWVEGKLALLQADVGCFSETAQSGLNG